jgi:hypothetical protein
MADKRWEVPSRWVSSDEVKSGIEETGRLAELSVSGDVVAA